MKALDSKEIKPNEGSIDELRFVAVAQEIRRVSSCRGCIYAGDFMQKGSNVSIFSSKGLIWPSITHVQQ
jgi:hypothetical protein